jgi:ATP-dependent DNA helicase RecQ
VPTGGGRASGAGRDAEALHGSRRADEERLFECLRRLRLRLARERELPPYVVFSDKALRSMARNRPTDEAGFLRCHGVGERKLEQYGGPFIALIGRYLDGGGCTEADAE